MVVNDLDQMIKVIRTSDDKTAKKLITDYAEQKSSACIDNAWKFFRTVYKRMKNKRNNEMRSHIMDFNEESDCISLLEFTRYFARLEGIIYKNLEQSSEETRDYAAEIHDAMHTGLGSIRIDKRIIYTKD